MTPLKRYISHLSFRVDKPTDVIAGCLQARLKKVAVANEIQIAVKPTFLNGTAGRGLVKIKILPGTNASNSVLQVEVIPTSFTREGLYIVGAILLLWTIAGLIFSIDIPFLLSVWSIAGLIASININSLLVIVFGWTVFAVYIHLTQQLNSGKLENYVFDLVKYLKQCKPSREP